MKTWVFYISLSLFSPLPPNLCLFLHISVFTFIHAIILSNLLFGLPVSILSPLLTLYATARVIVCEFKSISAFVNDRLTCFRLTIPLRATLKAEHIKTFLVTLKGHQGSKKLRQTKILEEREGGGEMWARYLAAFLLLSHLAIWKLWNEKLRTLAKKQCGKYCLRVWEAEKSFQKSNETEKRKMMLSAHEGEALVNTTEFQLNPPKGHNPGVRENGKKISPHNPNL